MTITALPSPPLITDPPDVFDTKASAHVASLSTLVTETNAALGIVNMTKWISGTTYAIGDVTWSPADFQAYRRKTAGAGTTDPSADATNWQRTEVSGSSLQHQSFTAFTTGGTGAAFTLTPTPAITANAAGQRFLITLNAAPTGSPTLAVSGQAALNFKYRDSSGTKQFVTSTRAPSGYPCDVLGDGTDWMLMNPLGAVQTDKIHPITASVAASALTLTLNPTVLDFRSATLGSGTVNTRTVASPISMVVPSTATLGTTSAQQSRLIVLAIDNAGTVELAVANSIWWPALDETGVITTTTIAGGSNNYGIYSTTGRTSVPYRVVGFVESTQATAGTWATAPSKIQGAGGEALSSMSSIGYGQSWQLVTRTSGTTYYNDTGRPIEIKVQVVSNTSVTAQVTLTVNGASAGLIASCYGYTGNGTGCGTAIIPVGASYSLTDSNVNSRSTYELR